MAAKLFVSSESTDADLFLVVRAFIQILKRLFLKEHSTHMPLLRKAGFEHLIEN